MDNYQKFGYIAGQVLIGMGFGIVSAFLLIAIMGTFFNDRLELFSMGLYGTLGFYFGYLVAVNYDGCKLLKKVGRGKSFYRHCLQSIGGVMIAFGTLYYGSIALRDTIQPEIIIGIIVTLLVIALPLAGATIGFNIGVPYKKKLNGLSTQNNAESNDL